MGHAVYKQMHARNPTEEIGLDVHIYWPIYKQIHVPNPIEELAVRISYWPVYKHVHA